MVCGKIIFRKNEENIDPHNKTFVCNNKKAQITLLSAGKFTSTSESTCRPTIAHSTFSPASKHPFARWRMGGASLVVTLIIHNYTSVKFKGSTLRRVLLTLNFILSVSVLGSSGPGPRH